MHASGLCNSKLHSDKPLKQVSQHPWMKLFHLTLMVYIICNNSLRTTDISLGEKTSGKTIVATMSVS